MPRRLTLALGLLCTLSGTALAGHVHSPAPPQDGHHLLLAQRGLSLDEASARVRKQTGGRILSARRVHKEGHTFYRFKVLMPNGVVRIIRIDAGTGRRQ